MMRKLIVTDQDGHIHQEIFDGESVKDSEVFHLFLCLNHPGDNYSVKFENVSAELELPAPTGEIYSRWMLRG